MNRDETIETLARLLAGLQVPLSLGGGLLGAAEAPYRDLLEDRSGFGWTDAGGMEEYLREALRLPGPTSEEAVAQVYCPECQHPWGYHDAERGCTMPLDRGGLPVMRTDETVGACGCPAQRSQ